MMLGRHMLLDPSYINKDHEVKNQKIKDNQIFFQMTLLHLIEGNFITT
jgi:hypothetical protein